METSDGTKVGRDWKVVKSEYVAWQETITRKQHDLHDDHKIDQPAIAFTERSMQRSQLGLLVDKDDLINYQLLIIYQLLIRTFITYQPTVDKTIVLSTNC